MGLKEKSNTIKKVFKKLISTQKPLDSVNGVYLGEDRFLRVVNQPENKPDYVSDVSGTATSFQLASRYGNIGLIAHNYLSGKYFYDLGIGDRIFLMDGYQQRRSYRVTAIHKYQALNPRSSRSNFIDLETGQVQDVNTVFKKIYTGDHHLILQTCIEKGNIKEWGRLFIIAEPVIFEPVEITDYRQAE